MGLASRRSRPGAAAAPHRRFRPAPCHPDAVRRARHRRRWRAGAPAPLPDSGRPPGVVVIAVDAENAATEACLKALLTPPGRGLRVLVIDDAPTELPLAALLDRVAGWRHVTPIRRPAMHGFAAGINAAI